MQEAYVKVNSISQPGRATVPRYLVKRYSRCFCGGIFGWDLHSSDRFWVKQIALYNAGGSKLKAWKEQRPDTSLRPVHPHCPPRLEGFYQQTAFGLQVRHQRFPGPWLDGFCPWTCGTGFSLVSGLPTHPAHFGLAGFYNRMSKSLRANLSLYASIFCFLKVCFMPLHFLERPTLVPVFLNQKNSEEDFCF